MSRARSSWSRPLRAGPGRRGAAPLALATLALAACEETVGFLSIDLTVPAREPPVVCDGDPRRATALSLVATCDSGTVEASFAVAKGQTTPVSIGGIPLGKCTVEAKARNAAKRVVLSGKGSVEVQRGENKALEITLLEERCRDASCDPDGDGLDSDDERKLGTDPKAADSDGDGLEDGLEVIQCCSDPLSPGGPNCKLLIQRVEPGIGVPGESVLIKASVPLSSPSVELGGQPLEDPLGDGTVVFGKVGKRAALGEVRLAAGGASDTYGELFAVLREQPKLVSDVHQRAGAKLGLMLQLVDLLTVGNVVILLGANDSKTPVLVLVDRATDLYLPIPIPASAAPISVAASSKLIAVLLRDQSGPSVIVAVQLPLSAPLGYRPTVKLPGDRVPVAIALEASGEIALVLYRYGLQRVQLAANAAGAATSAYVGLDVGGTKPGPAPDPSNTSAAGCVGIAYRATKSGSGGIEGTAIAGCSTPALCPPGIKCENLTHLLQLGPLEKCLPLDGKAQPSVQCWRWQAAAGFGAALGAPVVDDKTQQIYQLTTEGLLAATIGGTGPLKPILPHRFEGDAQSQRMLALDPDRGFLYAADGRKVLRLEPRREGPDLRRGRPFLAGRDGELAVFVGLSADGSVLDIGRRKQAQTASLASVCARRCTGCLCGDK